MEFACLCGERRPEAFRASEPRRCKACRRSYNTARRAARRPSPAPPIAPGPRQRRARRLADVVTVPRGTLANRVAGGFTWPELVALELLRQEEEPEGA